MAPDSCWIFRLSCVGGGSVVALLTLNVALRDNRIMEKSMKIEKWKQVRAKGKARFIWMNGFLLWGVSTAVLWSILMQLFQPQEPIWVNRLSLLSFFPLAV